MIEHKYRIRMFLNLTLFPSGEKDKKLDKTDVILDDRV